MTGKERIIKALSGSAPDRTPVMEMGIDWSVMRSLGYRRYLDMINHLDLDGVTVNQMMYVLGWRRWVIPFLTDYVDEWGVTSRLTSDLLPIPVRHPIGSPNDLAGFRPPRPDRSPLLKAIHHVRRRCPDKAIAVLIRNDFAASWFLCGMDVLLMAFLENPQFVDDISEMVGRYNSELIGLCVRAGADVVYLTDDYAYKTGTLMSREHFQRFVLPGLSRGVESVHRAGGLCIKHTDGDISGILDLIVATGVDGIGPLEPAAGNDLVQLRDRLSKEIALVGNIDVDVLSRSTADTISGLTKSLVMDLAGKGGHILSSGNTISASVIPENFRAMISAARSVSPLGSESCR